MNSDDGSSRLKFIYTDNHLLVADKPAGMPSQPDASGDPSLADLAREHLRRVGGKPGEAYLGLLHRLDRPTSGIVIMARTSKAAGRMSDLFRRRALDKFYLALVECHARPGTGAALDGFLAPADNGGMRPVARKTGEAREARLAYRTLAIRADGGRALLEVKLETGVKHQIRCQLAAAGLPVAGDFRYGPFGRPARPEPVAGGRAILLHAFRVAFQHPVRREPMALTAPPPEHWRGFLGELPSFALETT